jgi:glycosyltransferase involved in cell wall biosynthesis
LRFDDRCGLYRTADVFELQTRIDIEGFGLEAAEAMAYGTPAVASRIAAISAVVRDGVGGLLVEPDEPGNVTEKLGRVLSDDALRARLAEAAPRGMRERPQWDKAAEETAKAYGNVEADVIEDRDDREGGFAV